MNTIDLICRTRDHQTWATRRLFAAARPLSVEQLNQQFPIGNGSVMATLVHLYAAELVWLEALQGNPNPVSPWDVTFDDLSTVMDAYDALDARWQNYLNALTESDLSTMIAKHSTSSGAGKVHKTAVADILLHLPTHAAYTMAQCKNMMRQLGVEALPDVMLITLAREGG